MPAPQMTRVSFWKVVEFLLPMTNELQEQSTMMLQRKEKWHLCPQMFAPTLCALYDNALAQQHTLRSYLEVVQQNHTEKDEEAVPGESERWHKKRKVTETQLTATGKEMHTLTASELQIELEKVVQQLKRAEKEEENYPLPNRTVL